MVGQVPSTYMLVMLSAMSQEDQVTFADYPDQYGRCAFSGLVGLCKVVFATGRESPTKVDSIQETNFATQITEVTSILKTLNIIPAATTTAQIAQAAVGRSMEGISTSPVTYEEAEAEHPTAADFDATAADMAATLAAQMPSPGSNPN